ncbi:Phage-related protein, predicted endonuclease [Acinetobacter baumannii]|nr:Phage-related protein, predicted endonuclease [Acinetobacter baumannii]
MIFPPAVDASESAVKALQASYLEQIPLLTEDLTNNNVANALFRELLEEKRKFETHQQLFDDLKYLRGLKLT